MELGYVGAKGTHLRETRDGIQSLRASDSNPVVLTDPNGQSFNITTNTFANAIARTPTVGLNGYSGYQLFANDAYSIYHSFQATLTRRWGQGVLPGSLYILEVNRRDLDREYRIQHRLQRSKQRGCFARIVGLRPAASSDGQLCI